MMGMSVKNTDGDDAVESTVVCVMTYSE
ncbi:hypothethical protein (plasmid) [Ralstonia solanacearum CMR15]|nr:hypothethical protein [Ralstonia solanacearum CMR15]